jgi:DNA-directed RNA polymerase subunit M/transcription elongation factor TFIIS
MFAYDPITNKCTKLTFDNQQPVSTGKTESNVLRQYKNLFSDKPKPELPPTVELRPKREHDMGVGFDEVGSHCDLCNTSFATLGGLKLHMKMHDAKEVRSIDDVLPQLVDEDTEKFHCLICDRSFDVAFREVHMASHDNPDPVYCKVCNKQFENEQYLSLHMKALKDHNWFNFGQKDRLNVEGGTGTSDPTRLYACETCGRRFKRPHEKVKHERIHTGRWKMLNYRF